MRKAGATAPTDEEEEEEEVEEADDIAEDECRNVDWKCETLEIFT